MSPVLAPQDVLLLLAAGATGRYPLDPVRLMKGAFLVNQRGRKEWRGLFDFEAYDYGPFDIGVYEARDALINRGLLEVTAGRYDSYQLTPPGEERVAHLGASFGADADWIKHVGAYVTTRSFDRLLREIYSAHPEYAVRSRLK